MTTSSTRRLTAAIGTHGYQRELIDGVALSQSLGLDIVTVSGPLRNAMTRMVRDHEFDLCEMSPTSYLMARLSGAPLTALPVFPYRQFPFDQLVVRDDSAVVEPTDIDTARVGLRTWAQPTALWLREILASQYGCDLGKVQWTLVAEDPFATVARPADSRVLTAETLTSLLEKDLVDLAMGATELPAGCHQLLSDPLAQAREWYASEQIIPANHVLVIRDDIQAAGLSVEICELFERAKQRYLAAGTDDSNLQHLRDVTGVDDPLPNGWSANAAMWQRLVESMIRQGMLSDAPAPEKMIEPIEL